MKFEHKPVLLEESIAALDIKPDGIYLDCTAGGGGHSSHIAARLTTGRLIALDKDPAAVKTASERLSQYPCAKVIESAFSQFDIVLENEGITALDGILIDLGVSSHQLDTPERGFSYNYDSKLDMRMSQKGPGAYEVLNETSQEELTRIFREYGEERYAYSIAKNICKAREKKPVETTFEFVEIIKYSMPAAAKREGGHPAKRCFQAVRIFANRELDELSEVLDKGFEHLASGGRFAVISFHSLEDRMVKQRFASFQKGCTCPPDFPVCICGKTPKAKAPCKKSIEPSKTEQEENPRSRSARLRVIEKI